MCMYWHDMYVTSSRCGSILECRCQDTASLRVCLYVCTHACMDGWTHACMHARLQMDGWMHACMHADVVVSCANVHVFVGEAFSFSVWGGSIPVGHGGESINCYT